MKLWIFDEHSRYWYTLPDIYLVVFVYVGKTLNILHATCSFFFKKWVPSSLSHQSLTGVRFLKLDRIFYVSEDTVRHLHLSSDSDHYQYGRLEFSICQLSSLLTTHRQILFLKFSSKIAKRALKIDSVMKFLRTEELTADK